MEYFRTLLLLLIVLSCTSSSVSAINWIFDSKYATCEGDPFTDVYISATCTKNYSCNSGTCTQKVKCSLGDTPNITGRTTAVRAFSNSQIIVKPCLYGVCPKGDSKVDGRICSWIKPVSGQACGDEGDYQFDYLVQLPDEDSNIPQWLFDVLTLKIHIDKATGCQTTEEDSAGYQLPYPVMGLGAVAGLAVALCRHRRRDQDDDDDDGDDDDETLDDETFFDEESYFEMGKSTRNRSNAPHTVHSVHSVEQPRAKHQNQKSKDPLSQYKPLDIPKYTPPLRNLPQTSKGNPRESNYLAPTQKIPLKELRDLYERHGIAIV